MVILGALLMIGALLWLVFATRRAATPATDLPAPAVSPVTPTLAVMTSPASTAPGLPTPVDSPAIPYPELKRVSLTDAKAAFDLKAAVFIDVRGDPYYSENHVPGSISMTNDEMSSRMGELDKNAWIITYCT